MKLPNGELADLGTKIEDYCLNLNHIKEKNKAILFQNRLGITIYNAEILKQCLKAAALTEEVSIYKINEYGTHYNMKFFIKTEYGESLVLASWIIRQGGDFPRLTNCYPINMR